MDKFSTFGVILLLILAIVGGYMTGLFAGYLYDLAKRHFGKIITVAMNLVFYVVPIWALFGIASGDGLVMFYLLLLIFYFLGIHDSKQPMVRDEKSDKNYEPYD